MVENLKAAVIKAHMDDIPQNILSEW